jgi:hypothetical protein
VVWAPTSTVFVIWETAAGRAKRFRKTTGIRASAVQLSLPRWLALREGIPTSHRPVATEHAEWSPAPLAL